jgi:hypothetical protein
VCCCSIGEDSPPVVEVMEVGADAEVVMIG